MNILIFSWRGLKHPNSGGAEIVTHQHAKSWVKSGHQVTIFTSVFKDGKEFEVIDGVSYYRNGYAILGTHFRGCWWYLFINKTKFDLVIDQFHGVPYFTPLYVRTKRLAFIHEVTKEIWFLNHLPSPFNHLVAFLGYHIEPLVFKYIYKDDDFLTVSSSTKRDLVNWGVKSDKIYIIQNGISIIKPSNLKKHLKPTVTFLGALAKDKGVEDALKVFEILSKRYNDWQFWVVGSGDRLYERYLKKLVRKQVLKKQIKFWGFVSEVQKFKLLAKSHILVNPSVREGWGLVNIEANAVGTPVVGYKTHGTKDSVKHNKTGFLVRLGDIQGLVDQIDQLVSDEKLYKLISQQALNWSKNFNWSKQTQASLKLIRKLTI